jgi:hypothetical protein
MHRIDDASWFQSISSKFHHQLKDQAISISPPEYSHFRKYIAAMEVNTGGISMASHEPIPLDLKTVGTLKEVLDDAWYSLSAEQQVMMSKTVLAERILRLAAKGERDRERLLAAALDIAA